MLHKRLTLMKTIQVFLVTALVLLTVLFVTFQVIRRHQGFESLAENIRADHISGQLELIRQEVLQVVDKINYYRDLRDQETRNIVQGRVYEAYTVAEHLYRQNKDRISLEAIEDLIREALRPIRFSGGLGYFFMTRHDGRSILFADRPHMEGKNLLEIEGAEGNDVINAMIRISEEKGEGFYEYHWTKPDSDQANHKKISYIKRFPPLDFFIGTGLYVEDVEAKIQNELLNEISRIRFGNEGYIFVNTLDGNALITDGKLLPGDKKLWQLSPDKSKNLKALFEQEYDAALKPEGDYIYYDFKKLSDSEDVFAKASFVYGIPEWNWLIGAGVYLDEVEAVINALQNTLNRDLYRELRMTVFMALLLLSMFLVAFQLISRRYVNDYNLFLRFFEQAATDDKEIDRDQVRYADLRQMADQANRMLHDKLSAKINLQREKERFQELSEHLPVGVFEADLDLNLTYVNRKALAIFGYTSQDLLKGLNGLNMFVPEDRLKIRANVMRRLQSIDSDINEYFGLRKDGTTFPVISHSSLVENEGKVIGIRGFVADISEHKEREEEQLKLKKLESVGILAGGIAHDFNNLLAGFFGNIEMAKRSLPEGHKAKRYLDSSMQSLENATQLTQQLLTFAKGGEPVKAIISIDNILLDAAQFCLRGSNVRLISKIADDLYPVNADRGQLSQVISNLVINARQAMPEGGILKLRAENIVAGRIPEVLISVSDQGVGISPKYIDKIFDPYFTTKQKGSGLGLASCYSIVHKHGGRITVESDLNHGSTFTVYLPAASHLKEKLSHSNLKTSDSTTCDTLGAMVLVMDDEETIRAILGEMLKDMGYQVDYAADGEEALKKYSDALQNNRKFDAVICDLTIPGGMGGVELAKELNQLDSEVKIIVSSGYANDPVMANYQQYGFYGRIAKPFHFIELQKTMERMLNKET